MDKLSQILAGALVATLIMLFLSLLAGEQLARTHEAMNTYCQQVQLELNNLK